MTNQELREMSIYCDLHYKQMPIFMIASSYDMSERRVEYILAKAKERIKKTQATLAEYSEEKKKLNRYVKDLLGELEKKDRLIRQIYKNNKTNDKRKYIEDVIDETSTETLCDDPVELKKAISRLNRALAETYRLTQ